MGVHKEAERKYIVEVPSSWSKLSEMFDGMMDILKIEQTYLEPEGDEPSPRVRKTVHGLNGEDVEYHFNQKKPVKPGVHEEKEYEITKAQYEKHLKDARKDKSEVQKTRFVFKYNDQVFELDIFKKHLSGLAILEIELSSISDKVELPPFLKVIKDVTTDKKFNNYNLATKELHQD